MSLKQRSALRNVERASSRVARSTVDRDVAIRRARSAGLTLAAIATAAGLTRQRVWQLTSTKPSTDNEGSEHA